MRLPIHNTPRKSLNFRGDFLLPPKKPQKLICENLWVIYWNHELHESNEFDFLCVGKQISMIFRFALCFVL